MELVDYSSGVPKASEIKKAGFRGAVRYISPARETWMKGKPLTKAEISDFKANGLQLALVWQNLKEDWKRGFQGGVADAKAAVAKVKELGLPANSVIYFAIDSDPTLSEWNSIAYHYIRGARSIVGKESLGIYCNTKCKAWADQDGLGPFFWWKHGWGSDGTLDGCHIHQYKIDSGAIGGVGIDRNRTLQDHWGQVDLNGGKAPAPSKGNEHKSEAAVTTAPVDQSQGLINYFSTKFKSLVAGSKFATTLGTFIRIIDATTFRVERKVGIVETKFAEIDTLVKARQGVADLPTTVVDEPVADTGERACDCECDCEDGKCQEAK